jgi:hypothetical protein
MPFNKKEIRKAVRLFLNDLQDYGDDPAYEVQAAEVMKDFVSYVEELE